MDRQQTEQLAVESTDTPNAAEIVTFLSDTQLALVGGGIGDTVL